MRRMADLAAMQSLRIMSADSEGKERVRRPQVRSLYGPPIQSTTEVVPAQTPFPIKPVLDLFLEIGGCVSLYFNSKFRIF